MTSVPVVAVNSTAKIQHILTEPRSRRGGVDDKHSWRRRLQSGSPNHTVSPECSPWAATAGWGPVDSLRVQVPHYTCVSQDGERYCEPFSHLTTMGDHAKVCAPDLVCPAHAKPPYGDHVFDDPDHVFDVSDVPQDFTRQCSGPCKYPCKCDYGYELQRKEGSNLQHGFTVTGISGSGPEGREGGSGKYLPTESTCLLVTDLTTWCTSFEGCPHYPVYAFRGPDYQGMASFYSLFRASCQEGFNTCEELWAIQRAWTIPHTRLDTDKSFESYCIIRTLEPGTGVTGGVKDGVLFSAKACPDADSPVGCEWYRLTEPEPEPECVVGGSASCSCVDCGHGTCSICLVGRSCCMCHDGWSGTTCDHSTGCASLGNADCGHGRCVPNYNSSRGYICLCDSGWEMFSDSCTQYTPVPVGITVTPSTVESDECVVATRECLSIPHASGTFLGCYCDHGYSWLSNNCTLCDLSQSSCMDDPSHCNCTKNQSPLQALLEQDSTGRTLRWCVTL
jgi:hypothetical protein